MIATIGPNDARIGPPDKLVWAHRRMTLTRDRQTFPKSLYNGQRGRMRATAELTMQHKREENLLEWRAEVTLGTDTHLLFSVLGTGGSPEEAAEDAFAEVDARAAVLALELRGGSV